MRFVVLLGVMFVLASCSNYSSTQTPTPSKVFQYTYQGPERVLTSPAFASSLTNGKSGDLSKIRLANEQVATAKLGRSYFSASGYECRKYTVQSSGLHSACKVNGRWYDASPIILKK